MGRDARKGAQKLLPSAVICAVFAVLGSAVGAAASGLADSSAVAAVLERADGQAQRVTLASFAGPLWYHAAAFLIGFTAFGMLLIPALCAMRGFTAGYSLAAMVRLRGTGSLGGILVDNGLLLFLTIPFLLCISTLAMHLSRDIANNVRGTDSRIRAGFRPAGYFILSGACAALSVLGAAAAFLIQNIF